MKYPNLFISIKKLTNFALPISMSLFVSMISGFFAMLIVSKLGKLELAAGALAISTYLPVMMVASTIFYAVGILIGHSRGQKKSLVEIGSIVRNGFWFAVLLAIVASSLLCNIDKVLILFKQNPILIGLTKNYFYFAALSIAPTLILVVISQFFTGIGNPKFTLFTSILSCPINILLTYGLVLGKFGLPKLALGGITCATLIVQLLFCVCILIYMSSQKEICKYRIFSGNLLPDWSICKAIFFLRLPYWFAIWWGNGSNDSIYLFPWIFWRHCLGGRTNCNSIFYACSGNYLGLISSIINTRW